MKIEKLLDIASHVKVNKVDVQNINSELAATMETNNENSLPGLIINTSTKPIGKVATVLRASAEENQNHVAPIFGTRKYSASLSTPAYGF